MPARKQIDLDDIRIITPKQLRQLLCVSVQTIRRMIASGSGPKCIQISPYRIGFRLADVYAWQEKNARA